MFHKKEFEADLVSVIIPSFNHGKYILEAVESVLKQTYKNIELIVIDDGSKDNSLELLNKINDKRIKIFSQSNKGAHNTINRGLEISKGEYLAILNSDDVFDINRFKKMIHLMNKNAAVSLISSWIEIIDTKGKTLGIKEGWLNCEPWPIENPDKSFKKTDDYVLNLLMGNFVASTSNIFMRRIVYKKIGGMRNLRFAHDWDFLLRASAEFDCLQINEPLLKYRMHSSNTLQTNRAWMLFEICWVIAANIDNFFKKIMLSLKNDDLLLSTTQLLESFNFQGNDKVFWLLYWQINNLKKIGIENPEEIYLNNEILRNRIIEYIKE